MKHSTFIDPFKNIRKDNSLVYIESNNERIPLILRYKDVRKAAFDWKTFSSDAPFRVPIPSEETMRSVRQLPIETNPPQHKEYRAIVEPFFKRPIELEYIQCIEDLIEQMLNEASSKGIVEIVRDFSVVLQSKALTYLLNVPEEEADIWIKWGIHVFHGGGNGAKKGAALESYINQKFDYVESHPGEDFFSALSKAIFQGRALSRDEQVGFANLAFAGGRDTIINIISCIMAYVADHPEVLEALRQSPRLITSATEEFFRIVSPLTFIGRVCPTDTELHGETIKAGERVGLCWASANFDETIFKDPETFKLDRKPNPHIGFGFGPHNCLGAPQARLIVKTLLKKLCEMDSSMIITNATPNIEREISYERKLGFQDLRIEFTVIP